jgi:hypothetical protein
MIQAVVDSAFRRSSADLVLAAARAFTQDDIDRLAAAVNSETGYLGVKREWNSACEAAWEAGVAAGLEDDLARIRDAALYCVLEAAADAAHGRGRDVSELRHRIEAFQQSGWVDEPARDLQIIIGETVGRRQVARVGIASLGVAAAATAVLTWDLANRNLPYTSDRRDVLVGPWLSVTILPPGVNQD